MFGKPEWFVPKTFGWGLTPVTWQGWVYAFVWALVIALPFNLLLFTRENGIIEACVWMFAMIALVFYDVRLILRAMKRREEDKEVLHIMDDQETRREEVQTGKFQMHVAPRDR